MHSGTATLKDATSEAIRDWVTNVETTHYILGSAAGPHPYPMMVRDFQAVIGEETRRQCQAAFGGKPDILLACVGGGSNAIGLFHEVRKWLGMYCVSMLVIHICCNLPSLSLCEACFCVKQRFCLRERGGIGLLHPLLLLISGTHMYGKACSTAFQV